MIFLVRSELKSYGNIFGTLFIISSSPGQDASLVVYKISEELCEECTVPLFWALEKEHRGKKGGRYSYNFLCTNIVCSIQNVFILVAI